MRLKASFFMIFVSACLLLFITGCGGKKKSSLAPAPAPMPEQNQPAQAQAAEAPAPEKKKIKKKKKVQATKEAPADELPEELRVQEMTLPASSSQWTEKEIVYIRSAQKDLYDSAIRELTERLANPELADDSAKMLVQFVHSVIPAALAQEAKLSAESEKYKEKDEDSHNSRKHSEALAPPVVIEFYQLTQVQVRQIFDALSISTCENAKKAMAAFLAGTILTDDNKSALDSVLTGYAVKAKNGKITKEEEDFLLAFLLMPEKGVKLAAEYADVESPEVEPVELDQNGNPIQKQDAVNALRTNHQPIAVSPEKRIQFKFVGGNGNIPLFTPLDVQKLVLSKFCPFSSVMFRARIAQEITSQEVLAAADTEAKQAFLLNEVLEKFIMKRDFSNAIAHILIYKQPDLDEKWKVTAEENLLKSCLALTQNHFGFIDEKTLEDYKKAVQERAAHLASEERKRIESEQKAAAPVSTAQVPVSLLSKRAQVQQSQNRMEGNQPQAVQFSPLVELLMNPDECSALEKEVWNPEMRTMLLNRLEESFGSLVAEIVANMPDPNTKERPRIPTLDKNGIQTLQMYMTIPCLENRTQIYSLLDKAWLLGPEPFRQVIFDRMETEPGFLMVVKSLDRRVAPKEKEKRQPTVHKTSKSRTKTKKVAREREKSKGLILREKKIEIGTAWMDQTYNLVCQWCGKFSQAIQTEKELKEINRLLDPKLPKEEPAKLSDELRQKFQPLNGMDLVGVYVNSDPEMPPVAAASGLKITFIELRCTNQLSKLISAYKSKNPHLLERGKLGEKKGGMSNQNAISNATWLEKFEVNEETGRRESIDILFAPPKSAAPVNPARADETPRKGAEPFSIYVLVMEMDDLAGDHVSNLNDEDDEEEDSEGAEEAEAETEGEENSEEE